MSQDGGSTDVSFHESEHGHLTLTWDHISYTVLGSRTILSDISGRVDPGQMIGIMGPSGSGKTSLLNILAGRVTTGKISGSILVNGQPRNRSVWKDTIGFVEQDDMMYRFLTVRETIEYSALLRLPKEIPRWQKNKFVTNIISELGLNTCADTIIGDENNRGISGGERKRVSIGIELVTRPALLFLDEPTSGLDAFTSYSIIESIHKSARSSMRPVILTIHQPREDIFFLFDKLLLLSCGRVAYWGDTKELLGYFRSLGYECPQYVNPADFAIDTITIDYRSTEQRHDSTKRVVYILDSWDDSKTTHDEIQYARVKEDMLASRSRNSWAFEFRVLLSRCWKHQRRDLASIFAVIFQTLFLFLILGFTFFQLGYSQQSIQSRVGVLIFIPVNIVFSIVQPLLTLFPLERNIVIRERYSSTYRVSAFYLAKTISILPLRLVTTTVYALGIYYIIGLNPSAASYFIFLGVLLDLVFAAEALGLFIGSTVPTVTLAQIIGPIIILLFFIYGGNLAISNTIPWILRWLQYISMIRYSYMALFQNEFTGLTFQCYDGQYPPPGGYCSPGFTTGEQVIQAYNMDEFSITTCCLIILGLGFVFLIIGYLTLRRTTRPQIRLI